MGKRERCNGDRARFWPMAVFALCFMGCTSVHPYNSTPARGVKRTGSITIPQEEKPTLKGSYPVRIAAEARSRERIIGVWELLQEHNTISVSTGREKPHAYSQVLKNRYTFYADGMLFLAMDIAGKEKSYNGTWDYQDGRLNMSLKNQKGAIEKMTMNVIWYSDTEIELRHADLLAFERMFYVAPTIKSMKARYSDNGALETRMYMEIPVKNKTAVSIFNSIYSPMICERVGDAHDDN